MKPQPLSPETADQVVRDFFQLWFSDRQASTWKGGTTYLGIPLQQAPTDLWVLQELIHELRPNVIIEVGVKKGGQTLYLSHLMREINPQGVVLGVDVSIKSVNPRLREIDNVRLIGTDSVGAKLHALIERKYCAEPNALVILDSDHRRDHVLAELRLFRKYVPVGGYLIVNDTMINGHPIWPDWGPGPWEAVRAFLAETADFEIDKAREKHMLTSCPDGFLRRVK